MLTCVQIYNDWQTEWASADSRRLLPITSIPFWDVAAAAKEVSRCTALGHRGILFTGEPQCFGQPLLGDQHWNPLWEAAVEFDLPISFHVGSGDMTEGLIKNRVAAYGQAAAFTALAVNILFQNGIQVSDLICPGSWHAIRRSSLSPWKVASAGFPSCSITMDYQFEGNSVAEEHPEFDRLPSEYFARNVYACYWFEQTAPRRLLDKIGVDKILF